METVSTLFIIEGDLAIAKIHTNEYSERRPKVVSYQNYTHYYSINLEEQYFSDRSQEVNW